MTLYCTYTDDELIALLKKDDKNAYTEIYNRYSELLQNHAIKKTGDLDEVKDILQDIFTNLWLKRDDIPQTTNLGGYLYVSVRNRIFNEMAHNQVKNKYLISLQDFITEDSFQTDGPTREKEFSAIIESEINDLPPKMREIFLLSRFAYLSHLEISEKLNISKQTVSKQVTNALKLLRVKLNRFILIFFLF